MAVVTITGSDVSGGSPSGGGVGGASNLTTAGAVPYVASPGVLTQAPTGLFYDSANVRLGVGTGSPGVTLDVQRAGGAVFQKLTASSSGTNYVAMQLVNSGGAMQIFKENSAGGTLTGGLPYANIFGGDATGGGTAVQFATANTVRATITATTGNLLLGTTTDDGSNKLQVAGNVSIAGSATPQLLFSPTSGSTGISQLYVSGNSFIFGKFGSHSMASLDHSGLFTIYNSLVTTGSTSLVVRAGEGQSGNLTTWQNAAGSVLAGVTSSGFSFATNSYVDEGGAFYWLNRSVINSQSDGVLKISNNAQSDFNRLQFGGTTSSYPALKRSSAILQARLADDSANTQIQASRFISDQTTPSASTDAGTAGAIWADTNYVYVQTAAGTVKRIALTTF